MGASGTRLSEVPLPAVGSVSSISGSRQYELFTFGFTSFLYPGTHFAYNLEDQSLTEIHATRVPGFDLDQFVAEQTFFYSRDGTRVPMFIIRPKDLEMDGTAPTLLYGYAPPTRLAINGGSNGGLLVATCFNFYPHLFGACVADVGVLDMLRFHKFSVGAAWCSDYGNPDNSEEEFRTLHAYSPLHNVRKSASTHIPALLLTTGDHDDRVVPLHSLKYIAQVQHSLGNATDSPLLIRVEVKAGHGAGKPTAKIIEEAADRYAFIALALGVDLPVE